jgi:predicted phosphoribosyltransferase
MRFTDLRSAGRELALKLERQREANNVVVLGIAFGGVPVAHEVAKYLNAPLDFVIIRRLLAPQGPGSQTCAVNVAGSMVIDEELLPRPAIPVTPLDYFLADAIAELGRREQICRRGRPPIDLADKIVILVDCGIRSGLTMKAAIGAVRTRKPARIIAAAPVTSPEARDGVAALADELIVLSQPQPFGHVGLWYVDFSRPGEDRVGELLEPANPRDEVTISS